MSSAGENYRVILAPFDSHHFKHCAAIRIEVFVHEQAYKLEDELDEYDAECVHLLLITGKNEPVGTLRYFPPPKSKIGRVAIRKPFRNRGLGANLLNGLEALLRGELEDSKLLPPMKVTELHASSQVPVVPFYRGLGFRTEGDQYVEDGTPHIHVCKKFVAPSPSSEI